MHSALDGLAHQANALIALGVVMDNAVATTPQDRAQAVSRSYRYLAERGAFDIVYEEAADLVGDEQARAMAARVACSVRTFANMAGVDVPPPATSGLIELR